MYQYIKKFILLFLLVATSIVSYCFYYDKNNNITAHDIKLQQIPSLVKQQDLGSKQRFVYNQDDYLSEIISAQQAEYDIDYLIFALEHGYIGSKYLPEGEYDKLKDKLNKFKQNINKLGSISSQKFNFEISNILADTPDGHLKVFSQGSFDINNLEYTRPKIQIKNIGEHKSLLLKVPSFSSVNDKDFKNFIALIKKHEPLVDSIVLDLRGNKGGKLGYAMMLASAILNHKDSQYHNVLFKEVIKNQSATAVALEANQVAMDSALGVAKGRSINNYKKSIDYINNKFYKTLEKEKLLLKFNPAKFNSINIDNNNLITTFKSKMQDIDLSNFVSNLKIDSNNQDLFRTMPSSDLTTVNLQNDAPVFISHNNVKNSNIKNNKPILVLIDQDCASACEANVLLLKNLSSDTLLIGEKTKGMLKYVDPKVVILPYSKLHIKVPISYFNLREELGFEEKQGISPDVVYDTNKNITEYINNFIVKS